MIIFEEPLALLKAGEQPSDAPSDVSTEWLLTRLLLVDGKRAGWAKDYERAPLHDLGQKPETNELVDWIICACRKEGNDAPPCREDVISIYWAVCNNAFTLETLILRATFGSAFYAKAAYFNHSCDPNCLSLRMGGNMAIFAVKDIAKGEELTHSYLPSVQLLRSMSERANLLHFECKCPRCSLERSSTTSAAYITRDFPRQFALTNQGGAIGDFKMTCVIGSDDQIHGKGVTMLEACEDVLLERSLAALEVLDPCLQASYNCIMDQQPIQVDDIFRMVRLWHSAAISMWMTVSALEGPPWNSRVASRQLRDTATILLHVISGEQEEAFLEALSSLRMAYGETLDCIREDLAYLGVMNPEWQQRLSEAAVRLGS